MSWFVWQSHRWGWLHCFRVLSPTACDAFLGEKIDQQRNRLNVEICILIEAGTAVLNERATTADLRNQMMMDKYINLVRMFCQDDFVSPSLQDDMCIKLFNGKRGGYTGEKLWRKFKDWRKVIRTQYTPKLQKDIANYPSGHSMRDVYKKFALECYKVDYDVRKLVFYLLSFFLGSYYSSFL